MRGERAEFIIHREEKTRVKSNEREYGCQISAIKSRLSATSSHDWTSINKSCAGHFRYTAFTIDTIQSNSAAFHELSQSTV